MNRIGAGLAALAATALIGTPTVAYAADPLPDLSLSFAQSPVAEVGKSGATAGVHVSNKGAVAATAVSLTLDLKKLGDGISASAPDGNAQCKLKDETVTCALGQIAPAGALDVAAVVLTRTGAAPGAAGEITVTVDAAENDANPPDDTATFPVTVVASGADLVVAADDLNTSKTPAGPGDKVSFHGTVFNRGDTTAAGATITLNLHSFGTVLERYTDCTYVDDFPHDTGGEYVYGPNRMTCPLPELEPGHGLLFFNPDTGESAFNVTFGRNLPGPDELSGEFSVAPGSATTSTASLTKRAPADDSTFAAALARLQPTSRQARRASSLDDLDGWENNAAFRLWTKKNTLDVQVTAKTLSGKAGQTVTLNYEVVNKGPSDGGGPNVLITAPSGTVLLPAKWCWTDGTAHEQRPESKKLRCTVESQFPAVASGFGKIQLSAKLKIKSAPGTNGTIYAESCCVGSTESDKANNTAKIVFSSGGGGSTDTDTDTGGEGGASLPITGSPVAMVALAGGVVVVLGVVLMLVFRRQRLG